MRAIIYTRVSQDPKQQGTSVERQREFCEAECERHGWNVVKVFTDNDRGASRHSKGSRSEYRSVLASIESGDADVLVTWESSRAQRDLDVYLQLRKLCESSGVLWSYGGRLYDLTRGDDRFATGLDALLAEKEADQISERVNEGVRKHIAKGLPYGKIPYGYRREYDPRTKALVGQFIVEEQAKVIRECASRFLAGESANAIAKDLNARGVPSPRATDNTKGWTLSQIRVMLTKPTYIAKRTHNGVITGDGQWPAILDEDSFNQCVARFNDPKRKTVMDDDRNVKFLLTGIAKCGVCGGFVKASPNRGYRAYQCKTSFCVARKVEKVDTFVIGEVMTRLERPDFLDALASASGPDVSDAVDRYSVLSNQRDALTEEAKSTEIPIALLTARYEALTEQMNELEPLLRRVEAPTVLTDLVKRPREMWKAMALEQQREVLRLLVDVRILKVGKGRRNFDPRTVDVRFLVDDFAVV